MSKKKQGGAQNPGGGEGLDFLKEEQGGAPRGEAGGAGGPSTPFNEKIDGVVAKIVPQKWLGTAFAGAAVGAFLFFIFMILALVLGGEKTQDEKQTEIDGLVGELATQKAGYDNKMNELKGKHAEILVGEKERHGNALKVKEKAHDETRTKLKGEVSKSRELAGKARSADRFEKQYNSVKEDRDSLDRRVKQLLTDNKKLKSAEKEAKAAKELLAKTKLTLGDRVKDIDKLKADMSRKGEAENTFKSILAAVANIDDPDAKVAKLKELRDSSSADLGGTDFQKRLDKAILNAEEAAEKGKRAAAARASRDAAAEYKKTAKMAKETRDYPRKIEILSAAAEELAGTPQGVKLGQQVKDLQEEYKKRTAENIYREVMAKVGKKENRTAYEENLQALEDALPKIESAGIAAKLSKVIAARRKGLKINIAKHELGLLGAQIKQNKEKYDDNIVAAQAALEKARDTKYEAAVTRILNAQTAKRDDAIGRESYGEALRLVKASKSYSTNLSALDQLKARCKEGSSWAGKIEKLLKDQRKKLKREQGN